MMPAAEDAPSVEPTPAPTPPPALVTCGFCAQPVATYYKLGNRLVCDGCRRRMSGEVVPGQKRASFLKALFAGGFVALVAGFVYAVFVQVSGIQFALITIGIGWLVGTTIREVNRGFSSRRFQVLAVMLTYLASTMSFAPELWSALHDIAHGKTAPVAKSGDIAVPSGSVLGGATTPAAPVAPPAPVAETRPPITAGQVFAALGLFLVLLLASPFVALGSGVGGFIILLIIFFGMRTAWQTTRAAGLSFAGPFGGAAQNVASTAASSAE